MKYVVTGNKSLKFRVQGQLCSHDKPARVNVNHDILMKLQNRTLVEYKPIKKSAPISEPVVDIKKKKKIKNNYKRSE